MGPTLEPSDSDLSAWLTSGAKEEPPRPCYTLTMMRSDAQNRKKVSLARFELATFALHNLLHWSNYKNDTLAAASQGLVATVQFSCNMILSYNDAPLRSTTCLAAALCF